MSLHSTQRLKAKLANKKYRDAFIASRVSQTIALQAKILRQRSGLSQKALAKELNTSQNAVFRLENPKYGKHSLATLRKWASYFDVALIVRYAAFSELINWISELATESLAVPTFSMEVARGAFDSLLATQSKMIEHREDAIVEALATPSESVTVTRETGIYLPSEVGTISDIDTDTPGSTQTSSDEAQFYEALPHIPTQLSPLAFSDSMNVP